MHRVTKHGRPRARGGEGGAGAVQGYRHRRPSRSWPLLPRTGLRLQVARPSWSSWAANGANPLPTTADAEPAELFRILPNATLRGE